MGPRIKELRSALRLTQKEFGERIGVKPNTIGTYEIGRNEPIDAVVNLICREYNVNEDWLRTGKGEMFKEPDMEEYLSRFFANVMMDKQDFRRQLISVLAKMTPEEWAMLERKAWELVGKMKKTDPEGPVE